MTRRCWFLLGWSFLAVPAAAQEPMPPGPTVEDPLARAMELFDNGSRLYEEGRYQDAIVAWQEAYRLSGRGPLLFNIANAYERMGDYAQAIEQLNRYRAVASAEEQPKLERRLVSLEERRRELETLTRDAALAAPPPSPVAPVPASDHAPARPGGTRRAVGATLLGVGIASAGTGAVLGVLAQNGFSSASDGCRDTGGGLVCLDSSRSEIASSRTQMVVADVGFAVGALLSVSGVTLFATAPRAVPQVGVTRDSVHVGLTWAVR